MGFREFYEIKLRVVPHENVSEIRVPKKQHSLRVGPVNINTPFILEFSDSLEILLTETFSCKLGICSQHSENAKVLKMLKFKK